MQIDALTLAALADEFQTALVGARIDDVIQPTPQSVALQCYGGAGGGRNRWLMFSTHPQLARIHFTAEKPRKLAAEPPAFVMLLRKYLGGARVVAVRQPRWERVIELGFGRGAEIASGTASVWLIVELMGRNSNITLTDGAAVILGALRQVSADVNGYRAILPHVPYRYPPPQTRTLHGATLPRLDGADVTLSALREAGQDALATYDMPPLAAPETTPDAGDAKAHASAEGASSGRTGGKPGGKPKTRQRKPRGKREAPTVAGLLAAQVLGFSRDLGAEVAFRALGSPDAAITADLSEAQWGALARETRALAALPEAHAWQPTLIARDTHPTRANEDGEDGDEANAISASMDTLLGFSVYRPQRFPPDVTLNPAPSVNEALDRYFRGAEWQSALEGAKAGLRHVLQTQRDRCQRKAEALKGELAALDELARLRLEADTLLAYQTEIAPGQRIFTIADPFGAGGDDAADDGKPLTITLDPQLTAVENANRRYARYHKLQRAGEQIPPQIEANALELARIEQLQTDLALAETPAEVTHVRAEVAEAGYIRSGLEARRLAKEQRGKKSKGGKGNKGGKPGKPAAARAPEGGAPLRRRIAGGFVALVGKNSRQNEEVTFREAAPNDVWLHARGAPGAHVIIKSGGRPAPEETLRAAASLAAYYSQLRGSSSVAVDYTERRYVRHMQNGGPGMVIYERERTLHAPPTDVGEAV